MNKLVLTLQHEGQAYQLNPMDGMTLEQGRRGIASRLNFAIIADDIVQVAEGDRVKLLVEGEPVFHGFIFEIKRTKEETINVMAYDQLRYLKNKDAYVFKDKKASDILHQLCADFNLKAGEIADTGYTIPMRIEDNKTLLDIVLNALILTFIHTGRWYCLYDKGGAVCLTDIEQMETDYLLDKDTAQNYRHTSTIDKDTYNRIKIVQNNDKDGNTKDITKRTTVTADDAENQAKWGILQYFEVADEKDQNIQGKANDLLKQKNRVLRELKVTGAIGSVKVRGGSSIMTKLDVGGVRIQNKLVVNKVRHRFENCLHTMDMDLIGMEFE